jgi:hypothetical protein
MGVNLLFVGIIDPLDAASDDDDDDDDFDLDDLVRKGAFTVYKF